MFLFNHDEPTGGPVSPFVVKRLRDYQAEACDAVLREFAAGKQTTLVVLPTGMGKTVLFSKIATAWEKGNVLVLAHRIELLDQAADKLATDLGFRPPIEQGQRGLEEEHVWQGGNVIVGSVQTMRNFKRLAKYKQCPFGLVIVDEAHHAVSASYRRIIDQCIEANPQCKVLGVTATPNRADNAALGIVFDSLAYGMELQDAINAGWLVDIRQEYIQIDDVDFSGITLTRNKFGEVDFRREELETILTEEKALHAMAKPILDRSANGEKCLIFNAGVAHAHLMAAVMNRYKPQSSAAVDGKTDQVKRQEIVRDFHQGRLQYLCNFGVFCLDEETEILTSDGWVGIDEISYEHRVANWHNGDIFFDHPKYIVVRDRMEGERMVVLETPRRSIRVTEDHRMLYRTYSDGEFKIKHAGKLVGKAVELPVCGHADPFDIQLEQPVGNSNQKARLRANSYILRKGGMSAEEAYAEAKRRAEARDSLRYTEPSDLTEADCEFIGFWIGDGSRCKLQSGGIEYTVAQSPKCPSIVERIDWLLSQIGCDAIKRRKKQGMHGDHFLWSMPRGTGFGPQSRRGLFRLEPYLNKEGTDLFWAFSSQQFDALLRGLWMADGSHGNATTPPETLDACGISKPLFDLLQAVGTCRGWRINFRPQKTKAANHTPLLKLSGRKTDLHRMTKHCLQFEQGWKSERVWCVTSSTGNIITRRHGSVTVTGNTEGFDCPSTACVVMARPTKSVGLYLQMLGRGTRPLPGVVDGPPSAPERRAAIASSAKPWMVALDYVNNSRHKPVSVVDALGGNYDAQVRALAEERIRDKEATGSVREELEKAKADVALYAEETKRKTIVAQVRYTAHQVDVFGRGASPASQSVDVPRGGSSEGQIALLVSFGLPYATAAGYSKRQASAVIGNYKERTCTVKQGNILKRFGYDLVPFEQAKKIIDRIAANGWQRPS